MVAGELEIVRCALPLEAGAVDPLLALAVTEAHAPGRRPHLHSLADRIRRRKRVLVG